MGSKVTCRIEVLIILIFIILVFSIFAFIMTKIIRSASKEMNDSLTILATGDFTMDIDTTKTNEFGKMKKSLSQMVKEVSSIINVVRLAGADL